jgi:hypothetical protein
MRHAVTFSAATLAVAFASAACDSFESPAGSEPGDATANRVPQQAVVTLDDEYARVARAEVPGFAGFYLESDGTPVIQLKDPTQRGAAERYLAHQLAAARRGLRLGNASERPVFRTAAYDFAELKGWSNQVHGLLSRGDVYTIDVDEVGNRVRVGVRDAAAVNAVRAQGAKMGIPAAALYVETQPAPEQRATVQDYHGTMMGGIQIAGAAGTCTEGFNAVRDGYWIFVTNSHCTNSYFAYDGGWIYQPWYASGYEVGWEVADIGVYTCNGWWNPACRRADAAYIHQPGYRGIAQGVVARTPWASGGPASLTIVGQYNIVARYGGSPPVGTWLDKTGRTSGSTYGQVTQSCVTIGQLACQDVSSVWSQPGDSGSPMMVWTGGGNGYDAQLYGILWGGPSGNWNVTYSSPLPGIEADLGPLSQLCLPGYGC